MRQISDEDLLIFTTPGRELRMRVDVFRGTERVSEDLAPDGFTPSDFTVSWDLDGEIKQVADVDITYTDDFGRSLKPDDFQALFGPWGNDLQVSLEAHIGSQVASIPVGVLMIVKVPTATDGTGIYWLQGRRIVTGSVLTVTAHSQDERIARWGFGQATLKPTKSTCWDEIVRLTEMPVLRNVTDTGVPTLEYDRAQGDRLKQVQALFSALGGVGVVDEQGAWKCIPDEISTPVGTLNATVMDAPYSVDSEGVYNQVIGVFEDADRNPIVVPPASITEGPLAVDGAYGVYSRFYASEFVQTAAAARSALAKILKQVSRPTFERQFTALLDPRVEIGDTWTAVMPEGESVTGLITALKWQGDTMTGTLRFQEDIYA